MALWNPETETIESKNIYDQGFKHYRRKDYLQKTVLTDDDFKDVKIIKEKILNCNFSHNDFPNKCKNCQYCLSCPDFCD